MPTNRTYRAREFRPEGLTETQRALLFDLPLPAERSFADDVQTWSWYRDDEQSSWSGTPSAPELWRTHEADVLRQWLVEYPGSRPSGWWRFAAPGPRLQVGGIGEPWSGPAVQRAYGVPIVWNYGKHLYLWPDPPTPLDPTDPPMFESQATYLDRHGLLSPGEKRRLRPADFRPESIFAIVNLGDDPAGDTQC